MTGTDARRLTGLVLLAWAVWFTLVWLTNALDAAMALGLLPPGWTLASGNWGFIGKTTAVHGVPAWANAVMFAGVILWEALAAALFWLALVGRTRVAYPFAAGLGLFAAFAAACEVFAAYELEATHWRLFVAQAVSLTLVLQLRRFEPSGGANPAPPGDIRP